MDTFQKWRDKLLFVGNIVQDEDNSVPNKTGIFLVSIQILYFSHKHNL